MDDPFGSLRVDQRILAVVSPTARVFPDARDCETVYHICMPAIGRAGTVPQVEATRPVEPADDSHLGHALFFLCIAAVDSALWWAALAHTWTMAVSCRECGPLILTVIAFGWLLVLALVVDAVAYVQLRKGRGALRTRPGRHPAYTCVRAGVITVALSVAAAPAAFAVALASLR